MKTTIKEKLQKLDYADLYDLWKLAVYDNQELPKQRQLIDELSDYADVDDIVAAELSDEIDKLSPITLTTACKELIFNAELIDTSETPTTSDINNLHDSIQTCRQLIKQAEQDKRICPAVSDKNCSCGFSGKGIQIESPITGTDAKDTLDKILEVGPKSDGHELLYAPPYIAGYYPDTTNEGKQGFTTFDNTTKNCWVEFFLSEGDAIAFCQGKIEADEPKPDESPVIVSIRGGAVYAVDNVESDKTVEVRDYDIDGCDETPDNIDDDGERYFLSIY